MNPMRIFCFFNYHGWTTTHVNRWQIPTRQTCRCGAIREWHGGIDGNWIVLPLAGEVTFTTIWKPPVTHLMDDGTIAMRTLCGITFTHDWECGIEPQDDENIEDGIACGCLRCAAIAKKRIATKASQPEAREHE